jgi:hypothetical protein
MQVMQCHKPDSWQHNQRILVTGLWHRQLPLLDCVYLMRRFVLLQVYVLAQTCVNHIRAHAVRWLMREASTVCHAEEVPVVINVTTS